MKLTCPKRQYAGVADEDVRPDDDQQLDQGFNGDPLRARRTDGHDAGRSDKQQSKCQQRRQRD
jgi:hypothetical protein